MYICIKINYMDTNKIVTKLNGYNIGKINDIISKGNDEYFINVKYLKVEYNATITFINNELISFSSDDLINIGNYFLLNNTELLIIDLPNVKTIGDDFLYHNA